MGQMVENWNLKGKLSAKVAAAVFLSIVVIEAVILIPSYLNYERDLLFRLSGRTWTQWTPVKAISALQCAVPRMSGPGQKRLYLMISKMVRHDGPHAGYRVGGRRPSR